MTFCYLLLQSRSGMIIITHFPMALESKQNSSNNLYDRFQVLLNNVQDSGKFGQPNETALGLSYPLKDGNVVLHSGGLSVFRGKEYFRVDAIEDTVGIRELIVSKGQRGLEVNGRATGAELQRIQENVTTGISVCYSGGLNPNLREVRQLALSLGSEKEFIPQGKIFGVELVQFVGKNDKQGIARSTLSLDDRSEQRFHALVGESHVVGTTFDEKHDPNSLAVTVGFYKNNVFDPAKNIFQQGAGIPKLQQFSRFGDIAWRLKNRQRIAEAHFAFPDTLTWTTLMNHLQVASGRNFT